MSVNDSDDANNGNYSGRTTALANLQGGYFTDFGGSYQKGTLVTPIKDGAVFEGWFTKDQDGSYSESSVKEITPVDKAPWGEQYVPYYAKWLGMDDFTLQYGGSQKITVTGVELSGFNSDNPSVATVAVDGTVTATGCLLYTSPSPRDRG